MKNDDAVHPAIGVILMVVITVSIAAVITSWLFGYINTDENAQKYTENITISYVEFGDYGVYHIISTDNIEYSTRHSHIYNFAQQSVGKEVNIVYVEGITNKECYVTEIRLITNRTVCTVDKCGTPIRVK